VCHWLEVLWTDGGSGYLVKFFLQADELFMDGLFCLVLNSVRIRSLCVVSYL